MPVSLRRLNAETRTVLTISIRATTSIIAITARAAQFMPLSSPKRLSRMPFWSCTGLHAVASVEGGRDDLVLLRVLQLDAVRLLHLVRALKGAGQRGVAELLLVVLVRLVRRLMETFSTTLIFLRSPRIWSFCSAVTAPLAQWGSDSASLLLQRKIETLTLSYQ